MLTNPWSQAAALVLALFFVTPAAPLAGWTFGSNGIGALTGQLSPTGALYGYLPVVITVGVMPLFALGLEAIADPPPAGGVAGSGG
jgi:hypothetical protein